METTKEERYIQSIEWMHEYPGSTIEPEICVDQFASHGAEIFILGKPVDWKKYHTSNSGLLELLKRNHMEKLYVPTSNTFTGMIGDINGFNEELLTFGVKIMSGCLTDGLKIPVGSAALILTADCPTIVYHEIKNDVLIVAHAGLGSVVDLPYITTAIPSRSHEGVVDGIMLQTKNSEDYEIFISCGVGYKSFIYDPNHPVYGKKNKKILKYLIGAYGEQTVPLGYEHGGISIKDVIKQQFLEYGLDPNKIHFDEIDTYNDSRFWSHSRYFKQELGYCGRNGVLVLNKK
ncbi:MAG: laccase domain-containing protein [Candidatus Nomurabacteria bacterium]